MTEWKPSDEISKKIMFSPIDFLEPRPYKSFVKKDLYSYFEKFGLDIEKMSIVTTQRS